MIHVAVLFLALADGQTATQDTFRDIRPEVLADPRNAPFGFDITPDETVWLNMAPVGHQVDYAVRARDFLDRKLPYVTVWIRGYHKRDPGVRYRESKMQVSFDCQRSTYSVSYTATYKADGALWSEDRPYRPQSLPIVPGTQGANWQRFICKPPAGQDP